MPAEKRVVILALTERQSNFIFSFITMQCKSWIDMTEGIPANPNELRDMFVIMSQLNDELRDELDEYAAMDDSGEGVDYTPAMLLIAKAIHEPFCTHKEHKSVPANTGRLGE